MEIKGKINKVTRFYWMYLKRTYSQYEYSKIGNQHCESYYIYECHKWQKSQMKISIFNY